MSAEEQKEIKELREKLAQAERLNDQQYTLILQLSEQLRAYEVITRAKRIIAK